MINIVLAAALALASCPAGTTNAAAHHRWALKTRPIPSMGEALRGLNVVTVADLLAWTVPRVKRTDNAIDLKERTIYELTAYVRLIKLSTDDCDIHVQLSDAPTGSGRQVIVEAPFNQPDARAELEALVGPITTSPHRFSGSSAPRIRVVGYAFVDQEHAAKNGRKAGHGHGTADVGTLWELHPIWFAEKAKGPR